MVCVCVCSCIYAQLRLCLVFVCIYAQLRNKPREAPKRPKSAPFFLPTVAGLEPKFIDEFATTQRDDVRTTLTLALLTVVIVDSVDES